MCGLKQLRYANYPKDYFVTPCVGVWIETIAGKGVSSQSGVTPCVGVWIETQNKTNQTSIDMSHPAWVCGLKLRWLLWLKLVRRHTLRGCVD